MLVFMKDNTFYEINEARGKKLQELWRGGKLPETINIDGRGLMVTTADITIVGGEKLQPETYSPTINNPWARAIRRNLEELHRTGKYGKWTANNIDDKAIQGSEGEVRQISLTDPQTAT